MEFYKFDPEKFNAHTATIISAEHAYRINIARYCEDEIDHADTNAIKDISAYLLDCILAHIAHCAKMGRFSMEAVITYETNEDLSPASNSSHKQRITNDRIEIFLSRHISSYDGIWLLPDDSNDVVKVIEMVSAEIASELTKRKFEASTSSLWARSVTGRENFSQSISVKWGSDVKDYTFMIDDLIYLDAIRRGISGYDIFSPMVRRNAR